MGPRENSGHSLGEKSLPGLGKMRGWHPGEQPIHREHGKGSIWVLTEEASSKEQFGAAGLNTVLSVKFQEDKERYIILEKQKAK